jgi:hypothetical protein
VRIVRKQREGERLLGEGKELAEVRRPTTSRWA